jgi:PAS domain S-box-containing protein
MDAPSGAPLSPTLVRRLLDCTSDIVVRFDREFRHRSVNAALTRLFDRPPEYFLGRTHRELGADPAACELWEGHLAECLAGREVQFRLAVDAANGRVVHAVHLIPERDEDDQVVSVLAVGRDVTIATVEAERARLAAVVRSIADGLIVADPSGRVLDMNAAALRMHGFPAVEDARVPLARYDELFEMRTITGEVLPRDRCPISRVLRGEAFEGEELHVLRRDTAQAWTGSFSGTPVFNPFGRVMLAIVTVHDVTRQRQLESDLREREERYRLTTEAMDGLIYDWDARRGTVARSAGLRDLLGYEPHEVPPTQAWWLEQLHPDDRVGIPEQFAAAFERGSAGVQRDYRVRHRNGAWIWVWDHSRLVYDRDGTPVRVLGCTVSIDARKRAEEQLIEMDRLKDQFLMMLGHELRQPLHAMQAAARLVLLRAESDAMARPVAVIERQIAHLARLVDDISDVSRVKRGLLRITSTIVDLRAAVDAALEAVRPRAEADGQHLRWNRPPDAVPVHGDLGRLQQVVLNLLVNAHAHTPRGGTITVELGTTGDIAELRATDTGCGIAPDLLPRVFEIFVQGSDRQPSGMGIGLALVKGLVELHGGTVGVASPGPGRGSTFTVRLPLAATTTGGS